MNFSRFQTDPTRDDSAKKSILITILTVYITVIIMSHNYKLQFSKTTTEKNRFII